MEMKVIFEDGDLLVLDKPAGMIVNRADTTKDLMTVQDWVEEKFSIFNFQFSIDRESDFYKRAGIVHRLDKETSGILLVAKNPESFVNLQSQFKERKVQKTYIALAHGKIESAIGEINVAVGRLPWNRKRFGVIADGRESVTRYRVISNFKFQISNFQESLSLVELYPKTGRTHQIRVHLQYIHHPIFADPLYAGRKTGRNDRKLLPRIFLHASKISFHHPRTNDLLSFESPLPEDLKNFLSIILTM
ncbi:MAG: RluA family pseudouridine synthase [Candidatus Levybacteria bacterium]|nr:RluA family pseudouridine synthase [Candidatus Levybacteria bacterium]